MLKKDLNIKILMKLVSGIAYNQEKEKWKRLTSKLPDNFYYFELWRPEKQRSNYQNRYYWKVVIGLLCKELGYLPNEKEIVHNAMKNEFLSIGKLKGTKLETFESTKNLSTDDFWKYVVNIQIWAASELNINIPDPE